MEIDYYGTECINRTVRKMQDVGNGELWERIKDCGRD